MEIAPPRPITHILFDAVGTLIYPSPSVTDVYQQAGAGEGLSLSREEIASRFRTAFAAHAYPIDPSSSASTTAEPDKARWRKIVHQVFAELAGPARESVFQMLWAHFADSRSWQLFDDVAPTLNALRDAGFSLGIASNFDDRLLSIVAGHSALQSLSPICISSQLNAAKPSPSFFQQTQALLSQHPANILLVGDDVTADVQGALSAGWHAAWLQRDAAQKACFSGDLLANQQSFAIQSLRELPALLRASTLST